MPRFRPATIERVEDFSHRMMDVAEELERAGRSRRVVDQFAGSGTSVGANLAEADEALSRPDFCKCLGIVVKELSECRYWLRFVAKRSWITPQRLAPLELESTELKSMFGAMISRTRRTHPKAPSIAPRSRPDVSM